MNVWFGKRGLFFLPPVLAALLFLSGVSPAFAAGVMNVGVQLEPPNLDPTSGSAAAIDEIVYANVFEGLTRIEEDGGVAPLLATGWTVSDDGLQYRFALRRGVTFHDGALLSAEDVVFSLTRAGAENSTNAQRQLFENFKSVVAETAHSVRIDLHEPMGALPTYLGWGDAVIVSRQTVADNARAPVGTGPFMFVEWRKGASILLQRYDDYWGGAPALDGVRFLFISDPTAAFAALMSGDIDGFPNYPAPENLPLIERRDDLTILSGTSEGEIILAMNNGIEPFQDLKVRQALAHAIDRNAVIDGALYGRGKPIGSHFPPHHPAYVDLTDEYSHDPAKARELLAQAGYRDGFKATLILPPPAYARRSGEIIGAQLSGIGIDVTLQNMEWAQWLDQVFAKKAFELTIVSHTEPLDIDIYARDDYYFQYQNPAFNSVMEALRLEADPAKRRSLYRQAQTIIARDAPNVFLAAGEKIGVWRKGVTGVWRHAPVQANDFTRADIPGREPAAIDAPRQASFPLLPVLFGLAGVLIAAVATLARAHPAYLFRRALSALVTLIGASGLIFIMTEIAPGDPAAFMMGVNADAQSLAALREELGLNQPALMRYINWMGGLVSGNFGQSYTYRVPVVSLIEERLWVSLPLAMLAFTISTIGGILGGVFAASRSGRAADRIIRTGAQAGIAMPNFWLAILMVMVFSIWLGWFSAGGFPGWGGGPWPALKALLLPAIALAAPQAAILTQIMRSSLLEVAERDYIRTARAKGLTRDQALLRHGLRNALIPVLTILGLQFAFLVSGAVIIENVFYLPGLGRLVFQAIAQRDLIVVKGVVVFLVALVIFMALLVDLAYTIVDPRLRDRRQ